MRDLLWLVPLFPLAGFLVNGLLYLVSHRTQGQPAHGPGHDATPAGSPSAHGENPAHTHAASPAHDPEGHSPIPFKRVHSFVGTVSVGLSCVFAFLAVFDVGLSKLAHGAAHVVTLYRWIPLGVNQAVGQVPGPAADWFVDAAFRLDALSALMVAFVTFVGFLIHVYSVGYMGHEEGYGRYFAYLNLFMFSMLLPSDRVLLRPEVRGGRRQEGLRRQPHRRLRVHPRNLRDLRALRERGLRQGVHGGGRQPGGVHALPDVDLPLPLRGR